MQLLVKTSYIGVGTYHHEFKQSSINVRFGCFSFPYYKHWYNEILVH